MFVKKGKLLCISSYEPYGETSNIGHYEALEDISCLDEVYEKWKESLQYKHKEEYIDSYEFVNHLTDDLKLFKSVGIGSFVVEDVIYVEGK